MEIVVHSNNFCFSKSFTRNYTISKGTSKGVRKGGVLELTPPLELDILQKLYCKGSV